MGGFWDFLTNVVYLPYYLTKAFLTFILANIIIFIVLAAIIIITLIILGIIFRHLIVKIILFLVGLGLSGLLMVISAALFPLAFIIIPVLSILNIIGIVMYLIHGPTWPRVLFGIIVGPFTGLGILGWAVGESIEQDSTAESMSDFAARTGGTLAAYDGPGNSDRYRQAIAYRPQSKYYGTAMTMTVRDDIHNTDSGKFWTTASNPDILFLFEPAFQNLNKNAFQ